MKDEDIQGGVAPQDTSVPRGGDVGDITQGMGDLGVDDTYGGQEYSFGAPGTIPQSTLPLS